VASISSPVLRNAGTIGGNLCLDTRCTYYNQNEEWRRSIDYCMKEQGETCWVAPSSPRCWAVSSGDSVPMLCALGASITLVSKEGQRQVALADLFLDDGIEYLSKRPDEIVTGIQIPAPSGERTAFWKLRRRGSIDYGVLSVAAAGWCNGKTTDRIEIWLGSVGSTPVRCTASIAALIGKPLDEETIAAAAALARKSAGANPLGNTDFLPQWRGKMIEKYVEAVLREVAGLPRQRMAPNHG
jgi:4-hydroxybenzoyl-CoA reductase subunit beta